ncbi:hypothetical protein ACUOA8_37955, partial [Escherichia sp. SS-MK2]
AQLFQNFMAGFTHYGGARVGQRPFYNCASCKTLLPDAKTTRYNAGWLGIAGCSGDLAAV